MEKFGLEETAYISRLADPSGLFIKVFLKPIRLKHIQSNDSKA